MTRPLRFLSPLAISLVMFAGWAVAASRHKAPAQTRAPDTRAAASRVSTLRVIVISTQLADAGLGEWGFAALVDADGHRILFDTGAHPGTVLKNVQALGIDLSDIEDVVLNHFHADHTGGLMTLRQTFAKRNPEAFSRVHVGPGFFWSRPGETRELNQMITEKAEYERTGGRFVEHSEARQLYPGVWFTGAVPRVHPERNWGPPVKVKTPQGITDDYMPEDLSLVIDTAEGLVVISGCGDAGIINTFEYAQRVIRRAPIHAAIGGFHLFELDDKHLNWTADQMRSLGVRNLLGAHCTGLEAVYRIRERAGLARKTCVVGAVGSSFTLGKGIDPKDIAR